VSVTATDLFCGGGGSSSGAEMAGVKLRLGLNHWQRAIETHATNFQHADHDCEDVSSLTTSQIRRYPDSDILLASPECTNHSLSKGARRRKPQAASLFDDGPAGDDEQDRSRATMWDVVRFAEQKLIKGRPYKAVIVENVVDAYRWGWNDDGGLFAAWLSAMHALGYRHEIVWLNSMFCPPTPQSRDRMYVVFWRKDMRSPNLRVEPVSWCPSCERTVEGRQTWKRVDKPAWGRYGAQYYYTCPECRGTVLPGVFPAASIIDRELPAERIGERKKPLAKNTRERIRRGLERLASEPFAIRLLQRGTPKPLTLPLVTATTRHDMAMVMPVSGNTFERTPGNRVRDAGRDPMATVHGTLDRAVVVPYSTAGEPKLPANAPVDTLTRENKTALVYANRAHGVPKAADEHPSQTACTGETLGVVEVQRNGGVRSAGSPAHTIRAGGHHHGIIVANYSPGWSRRAGEQPIGSVTTQDGHSLVVPYMRTARALVADREPGVTLTARDRLALLVPAALGESPATDDLRPVTDEEIDECRFRMFALHEIAGAMSMQHHPAGGEYVVLGNKRERMAQYGNGVTPPAMRLLVNRVLEILDEVGGASL
jgi:DNA (cytosine-5)-methyltransferase 1